MNDCPMGLIDACVKKPRLRGCENYWKCDRIANTSVKLPYVYSHQSNCLTVHGVHPTIFSHYNHRPDSYSIEPWHHDLSYLCQEELESLGFASAVNNPSFDREIWMKYQPIEEDDPDDGVIPF